MRKFVGTSLFVGAAAAGAIALSASAAYAAPWHVTNGNPDGSFKATSTSVTFEDVTTNRTFTCTSSTISGTATPGTDRPDAVATGLNGPFSGCTGPLSSTGSAQLTAGTLNAKGYDSGSDTINGDISDVSANLTLNSILGQCNAVVKGSVGGVADQDTYANLSGVLTITADAAPQQLTIDSTSGACLSLINAGDSVTFAAVYTITSPTPPITVRPT